MINITDEMCIKLASNISYPISYTKTDAVIIKDNPWFQELNILAHFERM